MSFPRYERYKESGVEWLGKVPEHWQVRRLDHSFHHVREKVSDKDFPALSVTKNGIVPQLETAAKTDDGDNRKLVRAGDFVINGRSDRNGSAGLSTLNGSVSLINLVLRPAGIDGRFTHFLLRSQPFQQEFYRNGKGIVADLWSTGYDEMRNILLAMPTLDEQKKIATFLDHETVKIDALIEEQWRLIELLKEKRQAVISHAVTKGLDPAAPMKDCAMSWLGSIPESWEMVPLAYLVRFFSGGTPDKANETYWDGLVPWISPKDMKVEIIWDSQDHVTEEAINTGGLRLYREGHVLVVVRGMILAHTFPVAINAVPVTINQDMKAILCSKRILPEFLQTIMIGLNTPIVSLADESAHGTLKLDSSVINDLGIALPEIKEQQRILGWIRTQKSQIDRLSSHAGRAVILLQERRSALISAAVTGKIDVRNYTPNEAP